MRDVRIMKSLSDNREPVSPTTRQTRKCRRRKKKRKGDCEGILIPSVTDSRQRTAVPTSSSRSASHRDVMIPSSRDHRVRVSSSNYRPRPRDPAWPRLGIESPKASNVRLQFPDGAGETKQPPSYEEWQNPHFTESLLGLSRPSPTGTLFGTRISDRQNCPI